MVLKVVPQIYAVNGITVELIEIATEKIAVGN